MWNAVTGGPEHGVELKMHMMGKPYPNTFEYAEKILQVHRNEIWNLAGDEGLRNPLKKIYMIGGEFTPLPLQQSSDVDYLRVL